MEPGNIYHGDCLELLAQLEPQSVDLVFDSPPYENARTYGVGFDLRGDAWVQWMADRTVAALRVCRGLVATVVEGRTQKFRWSATPVLLMAELHRRGVVLRKPPIFHRVGIPGSGGPDWLRNDYEFIVCCTNGGNLPWSDNTAMGAECRYPIGGAMSHRHADGQRRNAKTGSRLSKLRENAVEPKTPAFLAGEMPPGSKLHSKNNGNGMRVQCYTPPTRANPGNVIKCVVGGNRMGSPLAHENEAPFPESLVEFMVRSFCPPGGIVLDRFCGSGTTLAVAERLGRKWIGFDVRESQVELSRQRIEEVRIKLKAATQEEKDRGNLSDDG